ncbi:conserved hypothetical protein [Neospora caninum Liverpool]|uniref:Nucleolar GTP-binding protein 1 Rossman-fold domain-containing protein n=1 Tax=Neospora caninum (strain Liverpool) TaxID=572307 RepID=F0VGV4_NEOCL|nr:conserved hypothetical protein [Neospora caninum Liverpool]CBZ52948.1 conserved hypothetical protein [Neospora caninum Liverpool]CEL66933.1 TPA: hypothetical protein BN1204_027370 [Neospora caninum Liverpool]|eukprot:XP_003882980.1 conserved hypothetical protein [Neospora caninum Liverpool]
MLSSLLARHGPALPASFFPSSASPFGNSSPISAEGSRRKRVAALAGAGIQFYVNLIAKEIRVAVQALKNFPDSLRTPTALSAYIRALLLLVMGQERELLGSKRERRRIKLAEQLLEMQREESERKRMAGKETKRKPPERGKREGGPEGAREQKKQRAARERFVEQQALLEREKKLADATQSLPSVARVYRQLKALYVDLVATGKMHASQASASPSVAEARERYRDGLRSLRELLTMHREALLDYQILSSFLKRHAEERCSLQRLSPTKPLAMIVGAPNVGKTSLFLALVSANSHAHEEARRRFNAAVAAGMKRGHATPPSSLSLMEKRHEHPEESPSLSDRPEAPTSLSSASPSPPSPPSASSFVCSHASPGACAASIAAASTTAEARVDAASTAEEADEKSEDGTLVSGTLAEGEGPARRGSFIDRVREKCEALRKEGKGLWEGGPLPDPEEILQGREHDEEEEREAEGEEREGEEERGVGEEEGEEREEGEKEGEEGAGGGGSRDRENVFVSETREKIEQAREVDGRGEPSGDPDPMFASPRWVSPPSAQLEGEAMELGRRLALDAAEEVPAASEDNVRTPEARDVSPVAFSTQGLHVGKVFERTSNETYKALGQILDGPPLLLPATEAERNVFERLTLTTLSHLPCAVLFLFDCSSLPRSPQAGNACNGEQGARETEKTRSPAEKARCPLTLEEQLRLRQMLRQRFPKRPWIDVISKADELTLHQLNAAKKLLPPCLLLSTQRSATSLMHVQQHLRLVLLQLRGAQEDRERLLRMHRRMERRERVRQRQAEDAEHVENVLRRLRSRKREQEHGAQENA